MGDGGIDQSPAALKSFSDYADEMCGYYMAIGVPYKQYWKGDPCALKHYVRAHELQNEQRNQEMWLQGVYLTRSVAAGMGSKDKQTGRAIQYFDKPIRITPLTDVEKAEEAENAKQKVISWLNSLDARWKAKNKK